MAAAAVGELLGAEPDCPGSRRPFPAGTRLQGMRLRDDRGQVMAQGYATAAEDAPGRGPFSAALTFTPPAAPHAWTVETFEVSAEDGRIVCSVHLPIWVGR